MKTPTTPTFNKLSICAIFKNEASYLKEWIEYHKLVGVEHFSLYNNRSEDAYLQLLQPYIQKGEVTLIDWPDRHTDKWQMNKHAWVYSTQVPAYEHAFKHAKSKWVAAIDIDEFIVPVKAHSITEVLEKHEKYSHGIEIKWRIYGSSDLDEIPPNKLMIEVLNKRSHPEYPLNGHYKTIVKPDLYREYLWPPHRILYVDLRPSFPVDPQELVINHYVNRSKNDFFSTKVKHKERMDNVTLTEEEIQEMFRMGNDEEDQERAIGRFTSRLRKKLDLS